MPNFECMACENHYVAHATNCPKCGHDAAKILPAIHRHAWGLAETDDGGCWICTKCWVSASTGRLTVAPPVEGCTVPPRSHPRCEICSTPGNVVPGLHSSGAGSLLQQIVEAGSALDPSDIEDFARSAFEEGMQFGVNVDLFTRYANRIIKAAQASMLESVREKLLDPEIAHVGEAQLHDRQAP